MAVSNTLPQQDHWSAIHAELESMSNSTWSSNVACLHTLNVHNNGGRVERLSRDSPVIQPNWYEAPNVQAVVMGWLNISISAYGQEDAEVIPSSLLHECGGQVKPDLVMKRYSLEGLQWCSITLSKSKTISTNTTKLGMEETDARFHRDVLLNGHILLRSSMSRGKWCPLPSLDQSSSTAKSRVWSRIEMRSQEVRTSPRVQGSQRAAKDS